MNTSVAGFSTVLPSQNATAPPGEAWRARRPATTGAAQQVHIMPGSDSRPPAATLPKPVRPSTRAPLRGQQRLHRRAEQQAEHHRLPDRLAVGPGVVERGLPRRRGRAGGAAHQDRLPDRMMLGRDEGAVVIRRPLHVKEPDDRDQRERHPAKRRGGGGGGAVRVHVRRGVRIRCRWRARSARPAGARRVMMPRRPAAPATDCTGCAAKRGLSHAARIRRRCDAIDVDRDASTASEAPAARPGQPSRRLSARRRYRSRARRRVACRGAARPRAARWCRA